MLVASRASFSAWACLACLSPRWITPSDSPRFWSPWILPVTR